MSFNRVEHGRHASLTLEKGIPTEQTGVRFSSLFNISTDASAPVNTLKCLVAVRKNDL